MVSTLGSTGKGSLLSSFIRLMAIFSFFQDIGLWTSVAYWLLARSHLYYFPYVGLSNRTVYFFRVSKRKKVSWWVDIVLFNLIAKKIILLLFPYSIS